MDRLVDDRVIEEKPKDGFGVDCHDLVGRGLVCHVLVVYHV